MLVNLNILVHLHIKCPSNIFHTDPAKQIAMIHLLHQTLHLLGSKRGGLT